MNFQVEVTKAAKRDLREILQWLRNRSPSGAETWYRRWGDVLVRLAEQADTLGLAPEDEDHDATIQQVIFRTRRGLPYRALFLIEGQKVFILRVRGPGQDFVPPDELLMPK